MRDAIRTMVSLAKSLTLDNDSLHEQLASNIETEHIPELRETLLQCLADQAGETSPEYQRALEIQQQRTGQSAPQ